MPKISPQMKKLRRVLRERGACNESMRLARKFRALRPMWNWAVHNRPGWIDWLADRIIPRTKAGDKLYGQIEDLALSPRRMTKRQSDKWFRILRRYLAAYRMER